MTNYLTRFQVGSAVTVSIEPPKNMMPMHPKVITDCIKNEAVLLYQLSWAMTATGTHSPVIHIDLFDSDTRVPVMSNRTKDDMTVLRVLYFKSQNLSADR